MNDFQLIATDCQVQVATVPTIAETLFLHLFRGALGRILGESASKEALAGQPCPFDPPCAFDWMHNSQGTQDGRPLPKPFVLRLDRGESSSVITMRLFGWAAQWRHVILNAMVMACRRGVDLRKGQKQTKTDARLPLEVLAVGISDVNIPAVPATDQIRLNFETPLVLRTKALSAVKAGATVQPEHVIEPLLTGLALRLSGLAKWHQTQLGTVSPNQHITIKQASLRGAFADRGPQRKRAGCTGSITLSNASNEQIELLSYASVIHAGSDTVIGTGRMTLTRA